MMKKGCKCPPPEGFTLAEVLITLGIIGVVAALTMPALISKHQKHVWYNQFRKAASVLENAINQYNFDHGCGQVVDEDGHVDNLCRSSDNTASPADKLGEYMNIAQWITEENYPDVCKGYDKLQVAPSYDGSNRSWGAEVLCSNDLEQDYKNGYSFITNDGMLFNFGIDDGIGSGSVVDTNGPNKGPNIYGRDIFVFYLVNPSSNRWGFSQDDETNHGSFCRGDNKVGDNCGIRLLEEGAMNY